MSGHDLPLERYQELLVRSVDGCLAEDEARELTAYLDAHPEAREEQAAHLEIKAITDAAVRRIVADAEIEGVRPDVATRRVVGVGFMLLFLGALAVIIFVVWSFAKDPSVSWLVKGGVVAAGLGGLTLFAVVLRGRLRARGRDAYEEIDR